MSVCLCVCAWECVHINLYVCVSVRGGVCTQSAKANGDQRYWIPLEGESDAIVSHLTWVLGIKLWSSAADLFLST